MIENYNDVVDKEFERFKSTLETYDFTSEDFSCAIANYVKLYSSIMESNFKMLDLERQKQKDSEELRLSELEYERQVKKDEEELKSKKIEYSIQIGAIGLPLIFYGCWIRKGMRFEETGSFTSTTMNSLFRNFISKIRIK